MASLGPSRRLARPPGDVPEMQGETVTSPASGPSAPALPDYAPVPRSALGPALNDQGYHVGRVERNLYWVTDGVLQAAFLTTPDGVVLFDAPPSIGHNLLRAIDPARPAPEVTFQDRYTLEVAGERAELAWHGPNHTPDNIFIHFPDHNALMLIDIVNAGWVPIYNLNL